MLRGLNLAPFYRVPLFIFIGLKMIDDKRTTLTARDLIAAWQVLHDIIQSHCLFDVIDEPQNNRKKAA